MKLELKFDVDGNEVLDCPKLDLRDLAVMLQGQMINNPLVLTVCGIG